MQSIALVPIDVACSGEIEMYGEVMLAEFARHVEHIGGLTEEGVGGGIRKPLPFVILHSVEKVDKPCIGESVSGHHGQI